jgi:hypothetical protein
MDPIREDPPSADARGRARKLQGGSRSWLGSDISAGGAPMPDTSTGPLGAVRGAGAPGQGRWGSGVGNRQCRSGLADTESDPLPVCG